MSLHLRCLTFCLLFAATQALAHGPGFFSDPVVTHTNGMRLASSTSTRSHNVYWQCESGHVGYCDGKLRSPCRDDWRSLGTRTEGQFIPPYTPMGPTSSRQMHMADGIEYTSSESLGMLGLTTLRPAGEGRNGAASVEAIPSFAPPLSDTGSSGGVWTDALQTISRKMLATPDP